MIQTITSTCPISGVPIYLHLRGHAELQAERAQEQQRKAWQVQFLVGEMTICDFVKHHSRTSGKHQELRHA